MIEIIAGVWISSFLLSSLLMAWNLLAIRNQLRSPSLRILNSNLAKVDLFWSNVHSDFSAIAPNAIENDREKALKNAALLGICCLASLPGLIFIFFVVISMRFLARERKEVAVFRSELARDPKLGRTEIEALVKSLRQII